MESLSQGRLVQTQKLIRCVGTIKFQDVYNEPVRFILYITYQFLATSIKSETDVWGSFIVLSHSHLSE